MVLVRPPLNNWPRKSVSNTNVKAEIEFIYIKRISTVDILLISSCFRMSDKWNPGIISRFLQIYFQGRILSLFIHHSSIYFQYTPIDSDGKRGFSMEWAKVSLWHLSSNGVTKTIYFFFSWHFWHSFRKWSFDTEVRSTFLPWTQLESPKRLFVTVFSKQWK